MKKTVKILIISMIILFILRYGFFLIIAWFGMEPVKGDFLKITNKTEKSLFYCYSYSDELPITIPFLDLKKSRNMKYYGISEFNILPDSSTSINSTGTFWKEEIAFRSQDKTLRIFTFDGQVISTISWEVIRNKNLWEKKYLITLDELELLKWSIELR